MPTGLCVCDQRISSIFTNSCGAALEPASQTVRHRPCLARPQATPLEICRGKMLARREAQIDRNLRDRTPGISKQFVGNLESPPK